MLRTDLDSNDILSEHEIDVLIIRLLALPGLKFNEERLKQRISETGNNFQAIMGLVNKISDGGRALWEFDKDYNKQELLDRV